MARLCFTILDITQSMKPGKVCQRIFIDKPSLFQEQKMNQIPPPQNANDHTRAIIIATTIILLTCILSCAAVLIILIMRTA